MDKKLTQGSWAVGLFIINFFAIFALQANDAVSTNTAALLAGLIFIGFKWANAPQDEQS